MSAGQPPENFEWQEPPDRQYRKPSKWQPVADALRANPGKWAKIVSNGNVGIKSVAEKGELRCFQPAGSFEGRTVVSQGRMWVGDVYLRYVGEDGEYR